MKANKTLKSFILTILFTLLGVTTLSAQSGNGMDVILTDEPLSLSYISDVNQDHSVNINDVVAVINVMAGTASWEYADVNGDNRTDINDVVAVINRMASNSRSNAYSFNVRNHQLEYTSTDNIKNLIVRVKITRGITNGRQELPLIFSGGSVFSAPSSVTFEDGSDVAYCKVTATRDLSPGETAQFFIAIDTLNVAPNGVSGVLKNIVNQCVLSTVVTVYKDYTWISLGTGQFNDTQVFDQGPYSVEIQKAKESADFFRVIKPYDEGLVSEGIDVREGPCDYIKFQVLHPGDKIANATVTKKDLVYYPNFQTGWFDTSFNAEVWGSHPSFFRTYSQSDDVWEYNKVLEYQDNGMPGVVQLAPIYRLMGTNYVLYSHQQNDVITIAFPGYRVKNYSVDLKFLNITEDTSGNKILNADITLGEDVHHAWVVTIPSEMEGPYYEILNGNITASTVADNAQIKYYEITKGGHVQMPMMKNAPSGNYYMFVYTFSSPGQIISDFIKMAQDEFSYVNESETWIPKYIGNYEFRLYLNETRENLVISQSSVDPTHYCIENWLDGVNFYFRMDADNLLSFDMFDTGMTYSEYGAVLLCDYGGPNNYYRSRFDGLVFNFRLGYVTKDAYFNQGIERFVITGFPADAGKNYKVSLTSNYSSPDEFVNANVTLGSDVHHAWVMVVPDSLGAGGVYQMLSKGQTLNYKTVTANGTVRLDMPADQYESGIYNIVVFTFDAAGKNVTDFKSWNLTTFSYKNKNDSDPWVSLGIGVFRDRFLFESSYSVEVQQSTENPRQFRLVNPYNEGLIQENFPVQTGPDPYLEFTIMQKGESLKGITLTQPDLVFFPQTAMGWYNTTYEMEVYLIHPSVHNDYQDETSWTHSKVLSYQANGLPEVVQLAPLYYMPGVGAYDQSKYDEVITITFPTSAGAAKRVPATAVKNPLKTPQHLSAKEMTKELGNPVLITLISE